MSKIAIEHGGMHPAHAFGLRPHWHGGLKTHHELQRVMGVRLVVARATDEGRPTRAYEDATGPGHCLYP